LNAAGAKDFLHTINQRCLNKKLFIYPSAVQGKDAANELIQAIQLANNHNIVEILVLIRGGGAKEDLECFNSESLASAIYHSKIPIITGIGHQIDTSIADLVCTKSFITPTAVAQNITAENINSKNVIDKLVLNTNKKIINYLNNYYEYIVNQENKLNKYENNLVTEVENNRINYLDKANNIKKNLISRMDNKFDYIIDSEEQLNEIFSFYYANINNSLKLYENNLLVNIDKYGQIIKLYEEKYKILSHPRILDKSDNEIISIKKLIKGNTYKIYFADGIFNLKL
jgi:exodeoxyribonuclease VII large subunit